jgi:uncharacterized protein (DUF433 family)
VHALHHVVIRTRELRNGTPVFAGSDVPVRWLLEHLDRGKELDSFLTAHPELRREVVRQALALGLEALLQDVPLEAGPRGHCCRGSIRLG